MITDDNALDDILGVIGLIQGYPEFWDDSEKNEYPTLAGAFSEVVERVELKIAKTRNSRKVSWFTVALEQIGDARTLYLCGDYEAGEALLWKAARQLEDGNKSARSKTRFVVGPDGTTEQVK